MGLNKYWRIKLEIDKKVIDDLLEIITMQSKIIVECLSALKNIPIMLRQEHKEMWNKIEKKYGLKNKEE